MKLLNPVMFIFFLILTACEYQLPETVLNKCILELEPSEDFTIGNYTPLKNIFSNNSADIILLQPKNKKQVAIFDLNKDFEIIELYKSNDYPSSDKDTTVCINWTLNKLEIKKIIQQSKPISGPEWHHLFGHYPCRIYGKLIQGTKAFQYSINSGSWFTVSSPDTTLMFGSFKEENNKYFLDSSWTEEEMEE